MTSQWTKLYQVAIHFHHQVCNRFESKCIFHFTALQHLMTALEKTARTTYHCEIPRNETTGLAKHHKMYPASWMWPFHTFSILFLGFYIVISCNFKTSICHNGTSSSRFPRVCEFTLAPPVSTLLLRCVRRHFCRRLWKLPSKRLPSCIVACSNLNPFGP